MIPLRVTAEMVSRVVLSADGLHLDALLMAAVARRDDLPPLMTQAEALSAAPLEIPVARSTCGRYYLASAAIGAPVAREGRYVQRRFPLHEAIAMGDVKRIATNAGPCKAFRIPVETQHIPTLTWYAVGEPEEIRALLSLVSRLGRRRAVGEGLVRAWRVEPCESWGDGFPVLNVEGRPLRHLPLDVAGIGEHGVRVGRCAPPYWLRVGEAEVACPI